MALRSRIFLWLMVLLGASAAAHAQIGTPVDLGSAESNTGISNSLTIVTGTAVSAGASILVIATAVENGNQTGAGPPAKR